jgi:hypothetical protein
MFRGLVVVGLSSESCSMVGFGVLNFGFYYQTERVRVNFLCPSNRLGL